MEHFLKLLVFKFSNKFKNVFGVSVSRREMILALVGESDKGIVYQNVGSVYSTIARQLWELPG